MRGEPVASDLDAGQAASLAGVVKALADPTRLRLVGMVGNAAPEPVTQVELLSAFDMSQPALAKHLNILVAAGVLASERRGRWTFYRPVEGATDGLRCWLGTLAGHM
jgi:ArsR family transcriptional regulator